jgi:hypothetical protein
VQSRYYFNSIVPSYKQNELSADCSANAAEAHNNPIVHSVNNECHTGVHMDAPSSSTQLQKVHVATAPKSTGSGVYASATGLPSSYEQVHGAPSREPVSWASVRAVAKEELTEVLYDKGEQIARVIFLLQALC